MTCNTCEVTLDLLNRKGYHCIIGSKVVATLQDGWGLPTGGVALGRVCDQRGYPVYFFCTYVF